MHVVIVESPAKAKTINKYLGADYQVLASYGHVRDLPAKDGSVQPDADFDMIWEVDTAAKKRLNAIADAVKQADRLILATDPDREGEAISWHVLEVLRSKKALKKIEAERVVFNAITKKSVLSAMENPRQIDVALVDAYLARRALDYLVGFTLSPVLWRKLPGARSAGRVQSVALRLVCEREREIQAFIRQEYWKVGATLEAEAHAAFAARLVSVDGDKLEKLSIKEETQAQQLRQSVADGQFTVAQIETKPQRRHPQPPFTTSTLQQEASRKFGMPAARTMQIAQRLYEGIEVDGETQGLITYMRTDGVQIAPEAVESVRKVIADQYGDRYLPRQHRTYKSKAKNAQEAHEAIRPTDPSRRPEQLVRQLDKDQARLYELIWKRTIASQMCSAELSRTTIDISGTGGDGSALGLRASGVIVTFPGFLNLYQEGQDDADEEDGARLPAVQVGDHLAVQDARASQHSTEPPPRFTEASLIKRMEELGIGRPSTYTQTMSVLRDRGYVRQEQGRRLVPEDKGQLVIAFLESFFRRYVEYDFTADLEEKLDEVSAGKIRWKGVLSEFWHDFIAAIDEVKEKRVSDVLEALNELLQDQVFPKIDPDKDPRDCGQCGDGRLSLKVGKYGAFIGCSNYPECRYTRQLSGEKNADENPSDGDRLLGRDPDSEQEVWLKSGRFGPYFERQVVDAKKPDRASLPKDVDPATADLPIALKYLNLPRLIGTHPESGKPISAGIGRYGPFVVHDGIYVNLGQAEEVFSIGVNRAVSLLAEPKKRRGATAKVRKELGEHPELGGAVNLLDGRYGPYVKHGKVNATIPRSLDPDEVTLEQALALLAQKASGPAAKKKTRASRASASK